MSMFFLAALLLVTPSGNRNARDAKSVISAFERAGRTNPQRDPVLDRAAELLATRALKEGPSATTDPLSLFEAVAAAEGTDASPKAIVMRANSEKALSDALAKRTDLSTAAATHFGVATVSSGEWHSIVVLLVDRKATFDPFPRTLADASGVKDVCLIPVPGMTAESLFVTRPHGPVERIELKAGAERMCGAVAFLGAGRHIVEALGRGSAGPEVLGMFAVDVGGLKDAGASASTPRATSPHTIVSRINALRAASGAEAVVWDEALAAVARKYAETMLKERFFAHRDQQNHDVGARLRAAGVSFRFAAENLGTSTTPERAELGIELSPAHRQTLLDPKFQRVGIGVATAEPGGAMVVQIFVRPKAGAAGDAGK